MDTITSLSQGKFNPWAKFNEENDEAPDGYSAKVLKYLKVPKGSAFDIGCGHGRSARALWKGGFSEVIMSDIHRPPEDKLWNGILFQQCRAEDQEFPDGYYGGGTIVNTTWYLSRNSLRTLLPRVRGSLRQGGVIAFNTLTHEDVWVRTRGPNKTSWIADFEVSDFTSGFRILEHKTLVCKPEDPLEQRSINRTPWHTRVLVLEKL